MDRSLRCFISAPADVDTRSIRAILQERGIEARDAYDFQIGDPIQETIKERIRQSDFAIVVVTEMNPDIYYEMGICEGAGKPILLVVRKDSDLPHFALNYPRITTTFEDSELLRMSLSKLIEELASKRLARRVKSPTSKSIGRQSTLAAYLDRLHDLRSRGKPREIEDFTRRVFEELGLHYVFNEFNARDRGVDFAVWNDSLASSLGNPLFVEIKSGEITPERISRAERQLQNHLASSDAKAAILLYLDKHGNRFREAYALHPLVLRYDLEDFLQELLNNSFEDVVLSKRNRIVHGGVE